MGKMKTELLKHIFMLWLHCASSFSTISLFVRHCSHRLENDAFVTKPFSIPSKCLLIPKNKDYLSKGVGNQNLLALNVSKDKTEKDTNGIGSEQQEQFTQNLQEESDDSDSNFECSDVPIEKLLTSLPMRVLGERTLDTAEDIAAVFRRFPYEKGYKTLSPDLEASRKTVVLLGSGWANHALMKVADCNKLRLIVVSPTNHFVFTPMLASAAVGTVEYRSMTEAVRAANPLIFEYLEGSASEVNVEKKSVTIQLTKLLEGVREGVPPTIELQYDHLVVAVGCQVDDKGVPGAKTKALRLKTCDDARRLRTAVGECLEYASRPDVADKAKERTNRATFLIVGGGATGVELAGELYDLLEDITRPVKGVYPKLKGSVKVILAHSGPDLVPQFESNLRKEALTSLEKKGVEIFLNTRVTQVGDGFAKLSTKIIDEASGETRRDEHIVPLGLTVWCAGTAPVPFVENLLQQLPESSRNDDGRIKVDRWMRTQMKNSSLMGSVLVLGDAAAFSDDDVLENLTPASSVLLLQTAQVAGQQGAFAARLLNRGYDLTHTPPILCFNNDTKSTHNGNVFDDPLLTLWLQLRGLDTASQFSFLNLGLLAYLGGGEALASVELGETSLFAYAGSVAFILWRSVYLVKQVATRNRILVTFDWIKSALFGRDITRL